MNKEKILKTIEEYTKDSDIDYRLDSDVDILFYHLEEELKLPFGVYLRGNGESDYWLQCEYHSDKLNNTIIWSYDVGSFDDADEVADYIIHTIEEIEDFERRLPDLSEV